MFFPADSGADERRSIDTAMGPAQREDVRRLRGMLLDTLAAAARRYPSDSWLAGQRVRFLVDQQDTVGALSVVQHCAASAWWCGALGGYVAHWRRQDRAADSLFAVALTTAPDSVRCAWTDLSLLLEKDGRIRYDQTSCAERQQINAVIWWLATPLFSEGGNDRRVEHYAREVLVTLHAAVEDDGRYDWAREDGGDAVRAMLVRYGWPTTAMWPGSGEDQGHLNGYLLREAGPQHITTAEYALNHLHLVPRWDAVEHPFGATPGSWEIDPRAVAHFEPEAVAWWPAEHYARDRGPLTQLFDYQLAVFRRDTADEIWFAANVPASVRDAAQGRPIDGALVRSDGPASVTMHAFTPTGDVARASDVIDAWPQLVGLELAAVHGTIATAARTRFGVTPPTPLRGWKEGAIALSDVALLTAGASEPAAMANGNSPASALGRMAGATSLAAGSRIGVYWETYGIQATDSIDVAVRIERTDRPGALRRLAELAHLVSSASSLTVAWHEQRADQQARAIPARIPTFGRITELDVSQLSPGTYHMTVLLSRGVTTISSARDFVIH
jgi:hypothetical protein